MPFDTLGSLVNDPNAARLQVQDRWGRSPGSPDYGIPPEGDPERGASTQKFPGLFPGMGGGQDPYGQPQIGPGVPGFSYDPNQPPRELNPGGVQGPGEVAPGNPYMPAPGPGTIGAQPTGGKPWWGGFGGTLGGILGMGQAGGRPMGGMWGALGRAEAQVSGLSRMAPRRPTPWQQMASAGQKIAQSMPPRR
jgi:hypothetical protein